MSKTKLLGFLAVTLLLISVVLISGCNKNATETAGGFTPEIQPIPPMLTTYEAMAIPPDNPMTPEKVALGRQLFFDERLSVDGTRSCYSCHVCEHGLTDGLPKAIGAGNKTLTRSSPTLWNIGYHKEFYWDGRSGSLEKQALAAWTGANMGAKADEIVAKLNALQGYKSQFQKVFGSDASPDNVVKAISAFERTIISGDTAWDRYKAGDTSAMNESGVRGWQHSLGPLESWRQHCDQSERLARLEYLPIDQVQQLPRWCFVYRSAVSQRRNWNGRKRT
jgi:cytochrome c peroxidase